MPRLLCVNALFASRQNEFMRRVPIESITEINFSWFQSLKYSALAVPVALANSGCDFERFHFGKQKYHVRCRKIRVGSLSC